MITKEKCELDKSSFIKMTEENKILFSASEFIRFLNDKGIRKVRLDSEYSLVWVRNFIVSRINPSDVKEMVLKELKELKSDLLTDYILNRTALFSMNYLNAVDSIDLKIHRDKSDKSFFYFKNGVVCVTKDSISKPIPFQDFKQYIWEDHILPRNYNSDQDIDEVPPVFADFITKLCNDVEQRFRRICSVIGYCLHDYKTSATARAVIIGDQEINSNPEGGSGKSLLVDAISKLRKTVFYDGKTLDPKAPFAWQKVDSTVSIVSIDDAKQGFNFEDLFSLVTGGFRNINRKNKDEMELTVEESPTIVISSNSVIRGNSGSFARRQYRVEVFQFFSRAKTPLDVYQQAFFSEWSDEEWSKFHVFMLNCVRLYLMHGVIDCEEVDSQKKELIRATSQSFVEWIEDNLDLLTDHEGIGKMYARDEYLEATNQKHLKLSDRKFTDYVKSFCNLYDYEYIAISSRRPRGFRIEKKK